MSPDSERKAEDAEAFVDDAMAPFSYDFDALVERAKTDPGEPFEQHALQALISLRGHGRAKFERIRQRLKEAGVGVTSLDGAVRGETDQGAPESQAQLLIRIVNDEAELFHTAEGLGFADVRVGGHRETYRIRSTPFKLWLGKRFYDETGGATSSDAMQSALNVLEAKARYDGVLREVSVRTAGAGAKIYLDLGTADWSAIEIDADGWRMVAEPPVRFRRNKGILPLPVPEHGRGVNALRTFLNVRSDEDFVLVVAWLVAALRNRGPYPVLVLTGEQGTAKSTLARILKALVDPGVVPLRSLPRDSHDLFIAANNGYALAFDNVSSLPPWLSDSLCRLATGGGFATRELYTDTEEVLFHSMRPIILNGIEDFVTRGDLADRAIVLSLAEIPESGRRDEETLWAAIDRAAPSVLGALLDSVVCGLKRLHEVKLERLPRMADFARWVAACEAALPWQVGAFMEAYDSNRAEAVETVLEADAVAMGVRAQLTRECDWKGTAADLLKALNGAASEETRMAKTWPRTPRGMSGALRRAAPGLRKLGFAVEFGERDKEKKRNRLIYLAAPVMGGAKPSEPSEPSFAGTEDFAINETGTDGQADGRRRTAGQSSAQPSAWSPLNQKPTDGADGLDGSIQPATAERADPALAQEDV